MRKPKSKLDASIMSYQHWDDIVSLLGKYRGRFLKISKNLDYCFITPDYERIHYSGKVCAMCEYRRMRSGRWAVGPFNLNCKRFCPGYSVNMCTCESTYGPWTKFKNLLYGKSKTMVTDRLILAAKDVREWCENAVILETEKKAKRLKHNRGINE